MSETNNELTPILERLATAIEGIQAELQRINNRFEPPEVVKSRYIAGRLGCSVKWIGDLARTGQIPKSCIVPGSGEGKQWRFYKSKIEKWLENH
jgi:predicted DNA-binding transcriptional regulator AlpA